MGTPLSRLMQTLAKPEHRDLITKSSGFAEILRPFVGFSLFCIGKLLFAMTFAIMLKKLYLQNFTSQPYSMYLLYSFLFLSPLGLHFFMAYQEFSFYTFCSFYRKCVNRVLETVKGQPKDTRIALNRNKEDGKEEKNTIAVHDIHRGTLYDDLKELVELMKNMTETFGPFLLQNLTLMLLFWLLHVYCLVYALCTGVPAMIGYFGSFDLKDTLTLCGQFTGLALVVM